MLIQTDTYNSLKFKKPIIFFVTNSLKDTMIKTMNSTLLPHPTQTIIKHHSRVKITDISIFMNQWRTKVSKILISKILDTRINKKRGSSISRKIGKVRRRRGRVKKLSNKSSWLGWYYFQGTLFGKKLTLIWTARRGKNKVNKSKRSLKNCFQKVISLPADLKNGFE
jgi:hypothetical protein